MGSLGWSLRKAREESSLASLSKAYGLAAAVSSGPWLISILTMLILGPATLTLVPDAADITRFQVMVTYLLAVSLILFAPLQLALSRVVADMMFEDERRFVLPNLVGALAATAVFASLVSVLVRPWFQELSPLVFLLFAAGFVAVGCAWAVTIVLNTIRAYGGLLASYLAGYGTLLALGYLLAHRGLQGLLEAFLIGQVVLVTFGVTIVARVCPSVGFVRFDLANHKRVVISLALTGLLYNLGIWIDKILFWAHPALSESVIGPLRNSPVYDFPIFIAFLTIVPGMTVFVLILEADLSESFASFYGAIRDGAPLSTIDRLRDETAGLVRHGLSRILRAQILTFVLALAIAPTLFSWIGISPLYLRLFYVDAAAVGVLVVVLAEVSLLFYINERLDALVVCGLLLVLNTLGTLVSQRLGPETYGYGFAFATIVTALLGLLLLERAFGQLVRRTFVKQAVVN